MITNQFKVFVFSVLFALCSACSDADHPGPVSDPGIHTPNPLIGGNIDAQDQGAAGKVSQPLSGCIAPPSFVPFIGQIGHEVRPSTVVTELTPPGSCDGMLYGSYEPQRFAMAIGASVPVPVRGDGKHSCWWNDNGNRVGSTGCRMWRTFTCGYGPGYAYPLTYEVTMDALTTDWFQATATIIIDGSATPGCKRKVVTNFPGVLL